MTAAQATRPTVTTTGNAKAVTSAPNVVKAAELLGPHTSITIEHNGQLYRLQSTRAGKLILTK